MSREPLIFRLPQDVEGRIRAYYQPRYNKKGELQECNIVQEVRSPALFFSKFMPSPEQKQLKLSFLRDFAQKMDTEELRKLVEHVRVRMEAQLCALQKALTSPPFVFDCLDREVVWRMVVGLGTANVLETSMTLHRLYGFPYIPGSAVKGITRSYAFWQIAERLQIADHKECLKQLDNLLLEGGQSNLDVIQQFQRIFGTTEHQGSVIFFDALPLALPKLELDIMNPHYSKYYDGTEPPADWLEPIPIPFLTVGKGSAFRFYFASQDPTLLPIVRNWLHSAVSQLGIGAKTRAGYGELTEASAQSLGGTARATLSAATADPTPSLETAIARWHARDMGTLPQLIEQLSKIPDAARRQQLAHQLQQKLKEAGKWTRNSQSKPWYQMLEKLMGGSPSEPSQS
jgi:CRISPR-associated protein Cmr6